MGLPFMRASTFNGASALRLLARHVLPNIAGAIIVVATLEFGLMVLFEAGLSFLGLGVQPPTPSWGSILSVGRNYMGTAWWLATLPGLCLFLLVLSINLIGDHLRDRLDPRSQRSTTENFCLAQFVWATQFTAPKLLLPAASAVFRALFLDPSPRV